MDKLSKIIQDSSKDLEEMAPWEYSEEVKKHEIVDMTLNDETLEDDGKLPLPKYFQDLYRKHSTLREFDLEEVVYDKEVQNKFMAAVLKEIETNQKLTPLRKREVWRSIRESKFVIWLSLLITAETTVLFCTYNNYIKGPIFAARTLIYAKMS